jgi:hypothetical protein
MSDIRTIGYFLLAGILPFLLTGCAHPQSKSPPVQSYPLASGIETAPGGHTLSSLSDRSKEFSWEILVNRAWGVRLSIPDHREWVNYPNRDLPDFVLAGLSPRHGLQIALMHRAQKGSTSPQQCARISRGELLASPLRKSIAHERYKSDAIPIWSYDLKFANGTQRNTWAYYARGVDCFLLHITTDASSEPTAIVQGIIGSFAFLPNR